jgi:prepilin-type processing-associated H-X9-DG protein
MRAILACAGLFAGLTAGAAPDPIPAPTKEQLAASVKNLRAIGIAFHSSHDANDFLPGDIISKDGKPLLSWRVALLPYLEEQKLYDQFKLDEPWDSAHNIKLLEKMPKVYAPVRVKAPAGTTYYQSFYGPKTVFDPKAKKRPTLQFISENNGTSNTILVIEAGVATAWTKPLDLPFDAKEGLPARGGLFDGDFHILFCDGSVRFFSRESPEKALKYAINPENDQVFALPEK